MVPCCAGGGAQPFRGRRGSALLSSTLFAGVRGGFCAPGSARRLGRRWLGARRGGLGMGIPG